VEVSWIVKKKEIDSPALSANSRDSFEAVDVYSGADEVPEDGGLQAFKKRALSDPVDGFYERNKDPEVKSRTGSHGGRLRENS
jgi:hypothetical protein